VGRESYDTVTTVFVFVSRPPPCTGGKEARDVFGRKLDSGYGGERPRGAGSEAPLARGECPWLSTELLDQGAWPSRGLPLAQGHQRGLVGTLRGSRYLDKNTSVIHESLRIYIKHLNFNLVFILI
jgi:hypothetical protein